MNKEQPYMYIFVNKYVSLMYVLLFSKFYHLITMCG